MEEFKIVTVPAIHPTMVEPCGWCGKLIEGYERVIKIRLAGWPMTEPHNVLLHPACVQPFAAKIVANG